MPLIQNTAMSYTDWATRNSDGASDADVIIEILNQTNEIFEDMQIMEGNLVTGHKHTIRTGIPKPTWRSMYQGVMPTKSETAQVTDTIGNLEAYSEPDKDQADLGGNTAKFRMAEAAAHIEGMGQEVASTVFYGNTDVHPDRFMGLAPRYSTLSESEAANAVNVLDAGGRSNNNTSIWMTSWGDRTCCGIYPKGSKAGLSRTDKHQVTVQLPNGSRYEAYQDHFKQEIGLALKDWRSVGRIANIDVTQLQHDPDNGGADLYLNLAILAERVEARGGTPVIYCNRTIREYLRTHRDRQKNVQIGTSEVGGKKVLTMDEMRIARCDAIINNEETVQGF